MFSCHLSCSRTNGIAPWPRSAASAIKESESLKLRARAMRIGPQHGITRRGLLGAALSGALVAGAAPEKSKVVIARDPALRAAGGSPDSSRVLKMLDRAMQSFYGGDSPVDAWKKVVRPGEVIGLKVNCLSGRGAATNPDRKSTRLNSSHLGISYAVFCLK